MPKRLLFLVLIFLFISSTGSAQVIRMPRDTTKVYSYIERYSKKRKFTKFVHRLVFKPTEKTSGTNRKKQTGTLPNIFNNYEGKIIRNIAIETIDPFGHSLDNPKKKPKTWLEKTGNNLHIKTRKWTIRNNLLFKKNDPLDSLLVKESERLIQRQRYIRNVKIIPVPIRNSKDSVDLQITVLDSWSLIPTGSLSTTNGNFEITERNFLGVGHEFENNFRQQFTDSKSAYAMRYTIPNFKNTFINTTLLYDVDFEDNYVKSIAFDRTFFSPYTKWAGGISFQQRFYRDSLKNNLNEYRNFNFKFETSDFWGGYSVRLFEGRSEEERISNLVTTFRYANQKFIEGPDAVFDPIHFFSKSKLYLTSIGITSRKFIESRYLFNNGIPEYVQIGKTYSFTTGFLDKYAIKRPYIGGRFSVGGFYRFGYLSGGIEAGTYFNQGRSEQTTLRMNVLYFSDLIELGNWKFRQFINPQLVIGNNRLPVKNDLLSINERNDIQGFTSTLYGTKKFLATFQTQSYAPGSLYGFRLSPFFNTTLGMISDENREVFSTRLYSKFGIGVLISNDYLVFNSFQISLSYYPTIPGTGDNILKTNTLKNNFIELPDFQIGKPYVVPLQ